MEYIIVEKIVRFRPMDSISCNCNERETWKQQWSHLSFSDTSVIDRSVILDKANASRYKATDYQDVSAMVEESQQSLDSTCDIPRMVLFYYFFSWLLICNKIDSNT